MGHTARTPAGLRAWVAQACARLRSEERGTISILEMLIAGTAAGVIFTAGFFFLLTGNNRLEDTEARRTTLSEEQWVIDRMAREIREASLVTPIDGNGRVIDVTTPTGDVVRWDCSVDSADSDSAPDSCFRGEVLEIDGLENDDLRVFTGFSGYPGTETTTPSEITRVGIRLNLTPDGRTRSIVLERDVWLRNRPTT